MQIRSSLYVLLSVALFDVASAAHAAYSEQWMTRADIVHERAQLHKNAHAKPSVKPPVKHEVKAAPLAKIDDDPIAAFAHSSKARVR